MTAPAARGREGEAESEPLWLPIRTARKRWVPPISFYNNDGPLIFLWFLIAGPAVGYWHPAAGLASSSDGDWMTPNHVPFKDQNPTHWTDIPENPNCLESFSYLANKARHD